MGPGQWGPRQTMSPTGPLTAQLPTAPCFPMGKCPPPAFFGVRLQADPDCLSPYADHLSLCRAPSTILENQTRLSPSLQAPGPAPSA